MVPLAALTDWLHTRLGDAAVYRPGAADVSRLSLALEPGDLPADLPGGAIFLHRAHRLGEAFPGLAVLNSHDGFDLELTTGPNLPLAGKLRWHAIEQVELERASGLIAVPPQRDWHRLLAALHAEVGGHEALLPPQEPEVQRVALLNALRPELLEAVAKLGVNVYLTGQMRPGALPTAQALGMGIVALGHRRTELWGLRQLAQELQEAFQGLRCTVYSG
jgi:putative NIF3 family GTP cyclohydrolase 1 type 2